MPKVILSRNATDTFLSQRQFSNESKSGGDSIGDWFRGFWSLGIASTNQYNAIVDDYLANESEASKTPSNLQGRDPSNVAFDIDDDPSHPLPIHK